MTEFKSGDRIRLVHTSDQFTKLKPGDLGTIQFARKMNSLEGAFTGIGVQWDSGSTLSMIPESGDVIELVKEEK